MIPPIAAEHLDVTLGATPILHDVSIQVGPGELVALLGGNGSGKTTLLRTLLGLIGPQSGTVALFGCPPNRFRDWSRIGYVPQRGHLQVTNALVEEVVTSGLLATRRPFHRLGAGEREALDDAFEMVNLTKQRRAEVRFLSGGQRQRMLIARALVGKPDLILLDEPLAGLDVATQEGLASVFARLKSAGLSVLVVLHELGPLEPLIDRSVVLQTGRVCYDGPLRSAGLAGHAHPEDGTVTLGYGLVPQPFGALGRGPLC